MNENSCIITSLNLYEFSQVNNNEMGVHISREDDAEMYRDTYEEAQRIIRISDEVRISLQKIEKPKQEDASVEANLVEEESELNKIPSSKLASKFKLKTPEFLKEMVLLGYLTKTDDSETYILTDKGVVIGAEAKKNRYGGYFIWPEDFSFE